MRNKLLLGLLIFLSACNKHFVATQYTYQEKKLVPSTAKDDAMAAIIQPYRDSLDKEMNIVLAVSDTILTKHQPESDLGNFMCDVILAKSKDYYPGLIDFTFLNYGGIRIPNLPAGNITKGKMIELMPFENGLVVIKVKGQILDSVFNLMAYNGGWSVAGASYKIKDKKALDIKITGPPLDMNKEYTLVVSDYLANGGDNCAMLKGIPQVNLKKTLRDALIEGLIELNKKSQHVHSVIDGRVQVVKN